MSRNRKDWVDNLVDTLWAYKTAFRTTLDMSPYRVVYYKSCYLPIEIEHRVGWAIRMLNYDLTEASEDRELQLSELEVIRADA